jgi:hypothetical protein
MLECCILVCRWRLKRLKGRGDWEDWGTLALCEGETTCPLFSPQPGINSFCPFCRPLSAPGLMTKNIGYRHRKSPRDSIETFSRLNVYS